MRRPTRADRARRDDGATHLELGTIVAVVGLVVVLLATMLANAARETFTGSCPAGQQQSAALGC